MTITEFEKEIGILLRLKQRLATQDIQFSQNHGARIREQRQVLCAEYVSSLEFLSFYSKKVLWKL